MKILLIEDSPQTIEFITIAFGVGWPRSALFSAETGKQGLELLESESPDLIILDIGLPDINGFDLLRKIRSFSKIPIIIITVRDSEDDIVKGLEFGADDYLVKPFGKMELLARVKVAIRRHNTEALDNVVCGPMCLSSTNQLVIKDKTAHLTPTEGRILRLLMANVGQLVTYADLAETIWGTPFPNSNDSIRVYIRRLRLKLAIDTATLCIISSISGIGYSLKIPH